MSDLLSSPITALYGVGKQKAQLYSNLGISTISDLINHYPRAYENRGDVKLLSESQPDVKTSTVLTVATEPKKAMIRRGMTLLKFRAYDDSGTCEITFFNQDYLKETFTLGSTFRFWGKIEKIGRLYTMSSPVYEPYVEGSYLAPLVPVYPLTQGLTQKQVSQNIKSVISLSENMPDYIPSDIRVKNSLCTLGYALRNIHFPEDFAALAIAKRRLVFDELFLFAIGISLNKKQIKQKGAPVCAKVDMSRFLSQLPFKLTDAQSRAVAEIQNDMSREVPMSRILVGDVGCGKTVCAEAAMYIAARNNLQSALMVPTEILAYQHYADIEPLMSRLGIKCALLIGGIPESEKKRVKNALKSENPDERIDIVIGTQALLTDNVEFYSPGLVITDEQHRFGAAQRALLSKKAGLSHVLVMSATPIPRSLALVMYGDLDISRINTMPPGRQKVSTFACDESYRDRLNGYIKKQVNDGGQVYIVCPAVEETEEEQGDLPLDYIGDTILSNETQPPLKAAVQYSEELKSIMPGFSIGFVHGRMKSSEKEKIMKDFSDGKIQILVSTTVIEVGVNVPNACLMVVENAERFGLSQLHQLRGRVGRGTRKSYCILMSESKSENAKKRLDIMTSTYDGYTIAEKDLLLRGPGDFFSGSTESTIRQSGGVHFKIAGASDDASLMNAAFASAKELIEQDPKLGAHQDIYHTIENMFSLDRISLN